jgi:hypothetical protein
MRAIETLRPMVCVAKSVAADLLDFMVLPLVRRFALNCHYYVFQMSTWTQFSTLKGCLLYVV